MIYLISVILLDFAIFSTGMIFTCIFYGLKPVLKRIVPVSMGAACLINLVKILLLENGVGVETVSAIRAVVTYVLLVTSFCLLLKIKITKAIVALGMILIIALIGEVTGYITIQIAYPGIQPTLVVTNPHQLEYYLLSNMVIIFVFSVATFLFYLFGTKFRNTLKENQANFFSFIMYFIFPATIFTVLVTYFFYLQENSARLRSLTYVVVFIFAIYLIASSVLYLFLKTKSRQLEEQTAYNQLLTDVANDLRRYKHDFKNILASIGGYLQYGQYEALKSFYNEIIGKNLELDQKINNYISLKIANPVVYGLVTSKLAAINSTEVSFKLSVNDSLVKVGMNPVELAEVLGILLDNALEASSRSERKVIELNIDTLEEGICISIANSFAESADINRLYQPARNALSERGNGLSIVREIIAKYRRVALNTYHDNNLGVVIQELLLPR